MELKRFDPLARDDGDGAEPQKGSFGGGQGKHRSKSRFWRIFWTAIGPVLALALTVFVTLTVVGVIDWGKMTAGAGVWFAGLFSETQAPSAQASDYWAVFLTSNQVYFGKLSSAEGQYLTLTDVFYLRAQRRLQPPEEGDEDATQPQERQEVQLIKLGDELHGPVDEIRFNRDNVLFLERLKGDSRVVKGIEQFKGQL